MNSKDESFILVHMKIVGKHLYWFAFLFLLPVMCFAQAEEFYGPFANWTNLKTTYHAVGNGLQDDTKAIQKALDELGESGHSPVLYIPGGIYRITATLTMKTKKGVAILGEDPEEAIIKWDGATGGKMFFLNGVSYSEYGRIKWDGNNKALVAYAHEWDGKIKYANSGSQHADEIFSNMQVGIKSGTNMDAEMSIRRCRFYNCSSTAISLQGSNALDWWIWDCYFENCNVGVANNLPAFGAGNFHVYRCIFNRSAYSDIALGNSNYFSFRDNISYNSNSFLKASQFSNTSPITLQNNVIINDNNKLMIDLFTKGNVLMINNNFITPDSGKNFVIKNVNYFKNSTPDITLIGNNFTAKNKLIEHGGGRINETDTRTGIAKPKLPLIKPYPFAPLVNYPVTEISDTIKTEALQSLINMIAAKNKTTIFHFKYGNYHLAKPLFIPPGAQLIFYGDGLQTVIDYKKPVDSIADAVIKIASPARCVIKNMWIQGNAKTDGVLVNDNDKVGNLIYGNQLMLFNGLKTNIWVNGFSNTAFRFENFQHNYSYKGTSVKMIGTGNKSNSLLRIFGGESAVNDNSYEVNNGGRILVYDTWYEGNSRQFISLKGNGEFYLDGAKIAVSGQTPEPFIKVDSFTGKVVIAQAIYNSPKKKIYFNNNTTACKFLTIGTLSWTDSTNSYYELNDRTKNYSMFNNRFNTGKGSYPLNNLGDTSRAFITNMLSAILQTSVQPDKQGTKKSTQLVFDRVMIDGARNNLRIERPGK
ncbi:MAG: glycosyl hydrolase family 28-related protein [Sphingobacteriales bacterium]